MSIERRQQCLTIAEYRGPGDTLLEYRFNGGLLRWRTTEMEDLRSQVASLA